jgi:shikimate kinase
MTVGKGETVVLIGMRGAGKSTVGAALARLLGVEFVDCDSRLEAKHRMSVREIFERHGETRFREWEREVLVEVLASGPPGVVATGGGAVLRDDSLRDVRRAGRVVYLAASPETLASRIGSDAASRDRRPALTGTGRSAESEVAEVLREREPRYRQAADRVVATDGRSPEEVAAEIVRALGSGGSSGETTRH